MAHYSEKPSIYEAVGNGSYLYRFDIKEVTPAAQGQPASEGETPAEPRSSWECEEVKIYAPVTANKVTQAVVEHKWGQDHEQKLVNEFHSAELGLYGDKKSKEAQEKINNYKNFLIERRAIKEEVDKNCAELGIY